LQSLEEEAAILRHQAEEAAEPAVVAVLKDKLAHKEEQITLLRKYHTYTLRNVRPPSPLKSPLVNEKHLQAVQMLHSLQDLH